MAAPDTHPVDLPLPMFWPFATATDLAAAGLDIFSRNLRFFAEEARLDHGLLPKLATRNAPVLDLRNMVMRDYGSGSGDGPPTLVDAPYAGHSAVIADYADGQSLIQTLIGNGLGRLALTDWKSATPGMKDLMVDQYLAEINVCVDELGGRVNLVGLCQGGWMSAMYAARFPHKVASLVVAGAPIDAAAGDGVVRRVANTYPFSFYEGLVSSGGGLMLGKYMLAGWKNMHPGEQYVRKHFELYEHIDDPVYIAKAEHFASWYETPLDLPGRWYLQVVQSIFRENQLARGEFVALGRQIRLGAITCPVYLLAGADDDITPSEQVFAAENLVGTTTGEIVKQLVPGGHIGLFMGSRTLRNVWPGIARWIAEAK